MSTLPPMARHADRKRGVTLIEAVLFISIALGLIVGGLIFFQQANLAARTNSAVRTISGIASEVRAMYRTQQSFAGITTATIINAGAVPISTINAAGNGMVNEWEGAISVTPETRPGGTADDSFGVAYTNVPIAACVRLISYQASGQGVAGSDIVNARVNDINAAVPAVPDDQSTPEDESVAAIEANAPYVWPAGVAGANGVTPAQAATACNDADAQDQDGLVTFTIVFGR